MSGMKSLFNEVAVTSNGVDMFKDVIERYALRMDFARSGDAGLGFLETLMRQGPKTRALAAEYLAAPYVFRHWEEALRGQQSPAPKLLEIYDALTPKEKARIFESDFALRHITRNGRDSFRTEDIFRDILSSRMHLPALQEFYILNATGAIDALAAHAQAAHRNGKDTHRSLEDRRDAARSQHARENVDRARKGIDIWL